MRHRGDTKIYETARVTGSKFYDETGDTCSARLPNYKATDVSLRAAPIQLTDSSHALHSTINKARLILFETIRRKQSVLRRIASSSSFLTLEGKARELDEQLVKLHDSLKHGLDVLLILERCKHYSLQRLLERMLQADQTFQDGNVILKRKLLRIERSFEQLIVEPLKHCLIQSQELDYAALTIAVSEKKADIAKACRARGQVVEEVNERVQASQGWCEATALCDKINGLKEKAGERGWSDNRDEAYEDLSEHTIFDRADGPQLVIDYLEGVLQKAR